jgi:hypothetical protein
MHRKHEFWRTQLPDLVLHFHQIKTVAVTKNPNTAVTMHHSTRYNTHALYINHCRRYDVADNAPVALCASTGRMGPSASNSRPVPVLTVLFPYESRPDSRRIDDPDPSEAGDITVGGERGRSPRPSIARTLPTPIQTAAQCTLYHKTRAVKLQPSS